MSTTEPEALRLAEILEGGSNQYRSEAAAELRRQHAEIAHADRYAEQMGRELSKATAEIADLRARLASIAGGVSPLMGAAGDAQPLIARARDEWHEDDGPVTWWAWCGREWAGEAPWCGTPLDSDWPGYHTHWTPCPPPPSSAKGVAHG